MMSMARWNPGWWIRWRLARPADKATAEKIRNAWTAKAAPIRPIWAEGLTEVPKLTNWGRKARKKKSTFGLVMFMKSPRLYRGQ